MNTGRGKEIFWVFFFCGMVATVLCAIVVLVISNALYLGLHDFLFYLGKSKTWLNLWVTLWTASIATLLSMCIAIPVGYTLSRFRFPCPELLKTIIDLPVMAPPAAIGVFLLGVFTSFPLSNVTQTLGIKIDHALPGVIAAQFTVTVSFCIRLVMASFDAVDPRYEQVGRCCGASLPRVFFTVSLPMARNGVLAGLIIVWARAAAEWESLMIFVGGIQGRTDVMPFAVYLSFVGGKLGWALTTSLFCVIIAIASMSVVHYIGRKRYE